MTYLPVALVFFLAGCLTWGCWTDGERKDAYLILCVAAILAATLHIVEVFR